MTRLLVSLIVLGTSFSAFSVPEDFRNWTRLGIGGTLPGTAKVLPWRATFQGRFHDNWSQVGETLLSTSVGYSVGGVLNFNVGFDWMNTAAAGAAPERDEYRPWQSIGGNITTGGAGFVMRAKFEERIVNGDLTIRFSQLFRAQWPIFFTPPTALFLSNQVFFHLNSNAPFSGGLDQNRFMLGIKHPFAGPLRGTVAYLNQAFPGSMNHILFLELLYLFGS